MFGVLISLARALQEVSRWFQGLLGVGALMDADTHKLVLLREYPLMLRARRWPEGKPRGDRERKIRSVAGDYVAEIGAMDGDRGVNVRKPKDGGLACQAADERAGTSSLYP